jgi:TPP-dependent indolepyruvate ferredoxin oxidoreductase alpha subunit
MFIPSVNSAHLNEVSTNKRKELKIKRPGKSVSTVRDILNAIGIPSNNLPLLNSIDKKLLPPRSTKIL